MSPRLRLALAAVALLCAACLCAAAPAQLCHSAEALATLPTVAAQLPRATQYGDGVRFQVPCVAAPLQRAVYVNDELWAQPPCGIITLRDAGHYFLSVATYRETDGCFRVEESRFVIVNASRGDSEWGLPAFVPAPLTSAMQLPGLVQTVMPRVVPRGVPFPFVVRAQHGHHAYVVVTQLSRDPTPAATALTPMRLYGGAGVLSLVAADADEATHTWRVYGKDRQADVSVQAVDVQDEDRISVVGANGECGPNGILVLDVDLIVPTNQQLTPTCGCTWLVEDGRSIFVRGVLQAVCSAATPLVIMPRTERWGGVIVEGQGALAFTNVVISGSGANELKVGHQARQAMILGHEGSSVTLTECVLTDGLGHGIASIGATIQLFKSLVTFFVSGAEIMNSELTIDQTVFSNFPDDKLDEFADDDNDALYIVGGKAHISRSVFVNAKDDGIDSGTGEGGDLVVESCLIQNCLHEGIALSNLGEPTKTVNVHDTLVSGCQQGLELGFSTSALSAVAERMTLVDNYIGVRYADNYGWGTDGTLHVSQSFISNNVRDVWNFHRLQWHGVPSRLSVSPDTITTISPLSPTSLAALDPVSYDFVTLESLVHFMRSYSWHPDYDGLDLVLRQTPPQVTIAVVAENVRLSAGLEIVSDHTWRAEFGQHLSVGLLRRFQPAGFHSSVVAAMRKRPDVVKQVPIVAYACLPPTTASAEVPNMRTHLRVLFGRHEVLALQNLSRLLLVYSNAYCERFPDVTDLLESLHAMPAPDPEPAAA